MAEAPICSPRPVVVQLAELPDKAGTLLGHSSWHAVTQERIDRFADATGDRQWIHVDPTRAAAGPFGATIAHGYLTLALAPALLREVVIVEGAGLAVNCGADRVRFLAPVPVGSRVRAGVELLRAKALADGMQARYRITVEVEGGPEPACVADVSFRYYHQLRLRS